MADEKQSTDPWQQLESTWREETPDPAPGQPEIARPRTDYSRTIARLGRRQQRISRCAVLGELLVSVFFGALAIHWLWAGSASEKVAAVFVLTTLIVVGILRRQAWLDQKPVPEAPPPHFVRTLLDRNDRGVRAIRLARGLLIFQVVFFLLWLPWDREPEGPIHWVHTYGFLALWSLGFLVSMALSRRYLKRERAELENIRSELDEPDDPLGSKD